MASQVLKFLHALRDQELLGKVGPCCIDDAVHAIDQALLVAGLLAQSKGLCLALGGNDELVLVDAAEADKLWKDRELRSRVVETPEKI